MVALVSNPTHGQQARLVAVRLVAVRLVAVRLVAIRPATARMLGKGRSDSEARSRWPAPFTGHYNNYSLLSNSERCPGVVEYSTLYD